MPLTTKVGALPEISATPLPDTIREEAPLALPAMLNVYAGAPALNWRPPTCVLACRISMVVMVEALNCAMSVAVGTVVQFVPVFQSLVPGAAFQAIGPAPAEPEMTRKTSFEL